MSRFSVEGVGELAELLADRVELARLLGGLEQGVGVYAGDLLHQFSSALPRQGREVDLGRGPPRSAASGRRRRGSCGSPSRSRARSGRRPPCGSARASAASRPRCRAWRRRAAPRASPCPRRRPRPWRSRPALRARAMMSSACSRASLSRARYSSSSLSASLRWRSAASMFSRIALARLSSASWMRGKATLLSTHIVNRKRTRVQIISPRPGETRKLPPERGEAGATMCERRFQRPRGRRRSGRR